MDPRRIGRYEIIRQLGVGGMGRVLLAHDPRLPRDVALKLLDKEPKGDSNLRERFEREARIIASLEHHAIVPVYDFGEFEGQLYLVMRLMRGGSLRDRLSGRPMPTAAVKTVVQRIASALQKAHSNGVIHRDLKPANILFDDEDKPYLSDFGIVKLYETETRLTKTGGILGTPAYMAPEQGLGEPVDGRSDIYSLGVVLYEMATGRVPFQAETPISTVLKHIQEHLPPPRSLNPDIDPSIERVVIRALAKNPDERYPTPGHMVRELQQGGNARSSERTIIEPLSGPQAPSSVRSTADEPAQVASKQKMSGARRSRPILVAGGVFAVFVLALAAGAVWSLFGASVTPTPTPASTTVADLTTNSTTSAPMPTPTPEPLTSTPTVTSLPTGTATAPATATPTIEPTPTSIWVWAPGTQRDQIAFVSNRSGRDAIYALDLQSSTAEQLTEPRPAERHWWPDWCGDDRLAFEAGELPFEGSAQEVWMLRLGQDGQAQAITSHERPPQTASNGLPSCSPDGETLAFSSLLQGTGSSAFRLGMLSLSGSSAPFRLIGDGYALAGAPSWSADGREIVFMHFDRNLNNYQIYHLALNNPDEVQNLTDLYSGNAKYPDWTAARGQVAFACQEGGGANAVWHLCLTPEDRSDVTYLLQDLHRGPERDDDRLVVAHAITPSWSPDGQSIAYASDVDGDWDIYVYELESGNVRNLTATWPSDEMHPSWRK